MAEKGWTARISTAAGVAAGTGAAQLGLGYGLGVVVWPVAPAPDDSVWLGSLGWATWIAASATVFGAVVAGWLRGGRTTRLRGPWRLALAASAAIGALVTVALIAVPARSAVRDDTFSPSVTAGGYALLGVALGLILAYWAVVSPPVAANLMATATWLWALAITAIVIELTVHRSSATYLNSWQFAEAAGGDLYGSIYWPSALLTLASAFVLGVGSAAAAVRHGNLGTGAAVSGAVGPLLVAASFLALAPQLTGALGPLNSAYLIAPYAVLAGMAGSGVTISAGRAAADSRARRVARAARREADEARRAAGDVPTADHDPGENPGDVSVAAHEPGDIPGNVSVAAHEPGDNPVVARPPRQQSKSDSPGETPVAVPLPMVKGQAPAGSTPGPSAEQSSNAPTAEASSGTGAKPKRAPRKGGVAEPANEGNAAPKPAKATPAKATPAKTSPAKAVSAKVTPAKVTAEGYADPEIAAAAQRGPARKAAPPRPQPKPTITPPPVNPTIAQINPRPAKD